ncbi:hypothetical protein ACO2Q0_01990 [Phenylobacterium sp. VNQ135]|uniref:hypothetical protein n=1 Tax=Phenylobacterium sp. VNQ135 TaxID=3400922 RepID=UPI003C12B3EB
MSGPLEALLAEELARPLPEPVGAFAAALADRSRDVAVLYYGSTLRTGDLSGLLDFYVLTKRPHRTGFHGAVERVLWPEVSYHEFGGLKAKVATLPLSVFRRAAEGRTLDTTIWTRFVQPAAIAWSGGEEAEVAAAVAEAVKTASRYAAALGPQQGRAEAYWTALFRQTYAAEFRVESPERADTVLGSNADRFARLLPMAWRAAGVEFSEMAGTYWPKKKGLPGWAVRSALGKPLNLARLAKAAFTFDGAAKYAAYKIEKHTGVALEVTPFRERHPILAAPGVLWTLRKTRKR